MVTLSRKVELEATFLISVAAAVSLFFVVHKNNQQFNLTSGMNNSALAIVPTAVPVSNNISISSQISSDGAKKVIMKITQNKDNTKTYDLSTADSSGANEQSIFSKTLNTAESIAIPFNTWSSDNKYFFIVENTKTGADVMAFKASGQPFPGGETYFDVTDLFSKRNTGNNFGEATGWASETLIVINSTKQDNTKGPSYWFEVPSKAIIPLSTEF